MNNQVPSIDQIFTDLDAYRDYCRFEFKPFNEAHLYKNGNKNWEEYKRFKVRKARQLSRRKK